MKTKDRKSAEVSNGELLIFQDDRGEIGYGLCACAVSSVKASTVEDCASSALIADRRSRGKVCCESEHAARPSIFRVADIISKSTSPGKFK